LAYTPANGLVDAVNLRLLAELRRDPRLPLAAYIRVRPDPGQLARVAELARAIPEVVECHRITGEDCFIVKIHFPAMDQLDRILDRFLAFGTTTTSIVQSSPVPLRGLPLPEV
jgi:Lrp/AsnC family leucine-responsive transcriptional regulator